MGFGFQRNLPQNLISKLDTFTASLHPGNKLNARSCSKGGCSDSRYQRRIADNSKPNGMAGLWHADRKPLLRQLKGDFTLPFAERPTQLRSSSSARDRQGSCVASSPDLHVWFDQLADEITAMADCIGEQRHISDTFPVNRWVED